MRGSAPARAASVGRRAFYNGGLRARQPPVQGLVRISTAHGRSEISTYWPRCERGTEHVRHVCGARELHIVREPRATASILCTHRVAYRMRELSRTDVWQRTRSGCLCATTSSSLDSLDGSLRMCQPPLQERAHISSTNPAVSRPRTAVPRYRHVSSDEKTAASKVGTSRELQPVYESRMIARKLYTHRPCSSPVRNVLGVCNVHSDTSLALHARSAMAGESALTRRRDGVPIWGEIPILTHSSARFGQTSSTGNDVQTRCRSVDGVRHLRSARGRF